MKNNNCEPICFSVVKPFLVEYQTILGDSAIAWAQCSDVSRTTIECVKNALMKMTEGRHDQICLVITPRPPVLQSHSTTHRTTMTICVSAKNIQHLGYVPKPRPVIGANADFSFYETVGHIDPDAVIEIISGKPVLDALADRIVMTKHMSAGLETKHASL